MSGSGHWQYPGAPVPPQPVPGAQPQSGTGNGAGSWSQQQQPPQPQYQQYQQYQQQTQSQPYTPAPPPPPPSTQNPYPGLSPALPPRPPGGAGPFLSQTYMNFPPPPRSPNRPPQLPPRPQQQQQYAQQHAPQPYAHTGYASTPQQTYPYAPQSSTGAGASPQAVPQPGTAESTPQPSYQSTYYPPPPPGPPPQQQSAAASASSQLPPAYSPYANQPVQTTGYSPAYGQGSTPQGATAQNQPTTNAHGVPDATNTTQETHYGYAHNAQAYSTQGSQSAPRPSYAAGAGHERSDNGSQENNGNGLQHLNEMLQSMAISPGEAGQESMHHAQHTAGEPQRQNPQHDPSHDAPYIPSEPVELPASTAPEPQQSTAAPRTQSNTPTANAAQPAHPQAARPDEAAHGGSRARYEYSGDQPPHVPAPNNVPAGSHRDRQGQRPAAGPDEQPRSNLPHKPVTNCIDSPVTFATRWYTHAGAPGAFICSKCYVDYLWPTQFRDDFTGCLLTDGVQRRCRFKVPRITDQLLGDAVSRGTLQTLLDFMNHRLYIPDCKMMDVVEGKEGIKFFRTKADAIPDFDVCEACFEDIVCISPFAYSFEPAPGYAAHEKRMCDMAVPFVRREFKERSKTGDWPSFAEEAQVRLRLRPCPKKIPAKVSLRNWFVPVDGQGPPDAVLCPACYCDHILKSGQEHLWQKQKHAPLIIDNRTNTCIRGQFHIATAMNASEDTKDWSSFWRALNKIAYEEKPCLDTGVVDGKWFTLPAQPDGFCVCGACFAGVVEPLRLTRFFVPQTKRPPRGEAVLCCMNVNSPRFAKYANLLIETWLTEDCTSFETFTVRFSGVPRCPRDLDYKNRTWFGWQGCVICAECYADFVQGTALDTPEHMPLRPAVLPEAYICEMYSPRMRTLYLDACSGSPPDPSQLLAFTAKRREVYWKTVPVCRDMVARQKLLASQASSLLTLSSTYTSMGQIQSITQHGPHYTYGQAGLGYGFDNVFALDGARYGAQASQMASQVGGGNIQLVGQLEAQWHLVE